LGFAKSLGFADRKFCAPGGKVKRAEFTALPDCAKRRCG